MTNKTVVLLNTPEGGKLVTDSCKENGLDFDAFKELVEAQITSNVNFRRRELFAHFDDILDRIKIEET
ncbi:MAG: hypothetical protein OXU71_02130 [Gammaproteobacteria bacterium]|nr:hypothetical protein [Gammaproteobacteria bacterium]